MRKIRARSRGARQEHRAQADAADIAAALCTWFARNARALPWRANCTAYSALVAEAMLQQTQVARVVERFASFTERFPTVHDLARAPEQEVLRLWQGMGYYRRACNLHGAARIIVDRFAGEVPCDVRSLRELPGVGRYTAGAIASIVFGRREAIVDGNVERVLARLHGRRRRENERRLHEWAWTTAGELVNAAEAPGVVNEAMMELGATVCTPRSPACQRCPLAHLCVARIAGIQNAVPPPRAAPKRSVEHHHSIIVVRRGRILLRQRPRNGLWSSMWQVPTIEGARPLQPAQVRRQLDLSVARVRRVTHFEHHTTHRRITFHVFIADTDARQISGVWRQPGRSADLPMSSAQRRILEMIARGEIATRSTPTRIAR